MQPGSLAARNDPSWQKLFGKNHALLSQIEIIWQNSRTFVLKSQSFNLAQISLWNFCQENSSLDKYYASFLKKRPTPKYTNCNATSLGITSLILMAMSKNSALSQKISEDYLKLPERQELFTGPICKAIIFLMTKKVIIYVG